jgi:predicted RNA-binding Zn-ribbon protein involved in translation (DUF1610 family)
MHEREKVKDCGHERMYCEKYDSFYCPKCGKWLEGKCPDPNCEFCAGRPEKPPRGSITHPL